MIKRPQGRQKKDKREKREKENYSQLYNLEGKYSQRYNMIKWAILDGKLLVCWKTCKWMREYLCTYVITILLQQMTSYRENSCRFLPWSCSFLFCLKDFLPRLQMTEFLLRWRSCSCFSWLPFRNQDVYIASL